jgi:predicted outer membrane protein
MIRLPLATLASACMTGLLAVAATAHAQTAPATAAPDAGRLHAADQTFIANGTQAVATQRDAARIATARSTDRDVKAFAERVSSDNAKISDALRAASPRGVDVPKNDPDAAVLASINTLRGADFDKVYIEQVALAGEQKALSAFQAEIAAGRDEQLKDAAKKALPTIQQHYAMAQELAKRKHLSGTTQ